jgi:H+-transporting ATPase
MDVISPATPCGLTSAEAERRLDQDGKNATPDNATHGLRHAFAKFWAPVPWMLEATIALELVLGKQVEAAIIAALLVFNAALGFLQESRAQATLAALKSQLAVKAAVRRDTLWRVLSATELVTGDVVKLTLGGVVPADVRIVSGELLLDQSMLTGESIPIEVGAGDLAYAGALIRRGEAIAAITATGARTKFGRTAELVRTAHAASSQQTAVFRVVRNLAAGNGAIILMLVAYAHFLRMPVTDIIALSLTAVLASIPVALPATFTLAAAFGARALAKVGVLPTRLSAVDEAASMDILCADKTGTLTRNELTVTKICSMPGYDDALVLTLAGLASSDGGQDPVDAAVRFALAAQPMQHNLRLIKFTAFDPTTKMSEAQTIDATGASVRVVKGAFASIAALIPAPLPATNAATDLEGSGFRVLAVAAGPPAAMKIVGLLAFSDPPRAQAIALVTELRELGVRTVMVTGDAPTTAASVARAVGLEGPICPPGPMLEGQSIERFAVFAGVLPEEKYSLVKKLQKSGHIVGMCGDGANDAPALRQAHIGIAVSSATDVAKSAAGMVLTAPGLEGVVAAVREGRIAFQRILTYVLNSVTKKMVQVSFLAVGLVLTGHAILTPLLMGLIMITGDFLGMSLTTDNVKPSSSPNVWHIGALTLAGLVMAIGELFFCSLVLSIGIFAVKLNASTLQTLAFIVIVFGNQATTYNNRARRRLWSSRPSGWLIFCSAIDILLASTLAIEGIAMSRIPAWIVLGTLSGAATFAVLWDFVKLPIFSRLNIN